MPCTGFLIQTEGREREPIAADIDCSVVYILCIVAVTGELYETRRIYFNYTYYIIINFIVRSYHTRVGRFFHA